MAESKANIDNTPSEVSSSDDSSSNSDSSSSEDSKDEMHDGLKNDKKGRNHKKEAAKKDHVIIEIGDLPEKVRKSILTDIFSGNVMEK